MPPCAKRWHAEMAFQIYLSPRMLATKVKLSTSILPVGVLGGYWWQTRPKAFGRFSTAQESAFFHVRWYAAPVKLYTDDGGVRPAGVLIVVKLHKCAPTNTLCQPPRVQANKLFLIIPAFTKGEDLQTKMCSASLRLKAEEVAHKQQTWIYSFEQCSPRWSKLKYMHIKFFNKMY